MQVCRSLEFYQFLQNEINQNFGEKASLSARNLFNMITKVKPGLIRVDADEVTYPLHIMLRYEIEKKLFNDELTIKDLPSYWNELMVEYFGISTKANFKDGVMQDVHWPSGAFGYFPAYTLGRMIAAQFFASFIKQFPNFMLQVGEGNFSNLIDWLNKNVFSLASKFSTDELLLKATGASLSPNELIEHIKNRYLH
jgi:carboxypeptidase Taq